MSFNQTLQYFDEGWETAEEWTESDGEDEAGATSRMRNGRSGCDVSDKEWTKRVRRLG